MPTPWDTTVVQYHNAIGIHDTRDALGDDEHGRIGNPGDVLANLSVGRHIDRAGGVIKNEHARMLEQRARDAQALLLATRDTGAALAQLAVQPADAIKELVHARRAASREELIAPTPALPHCRFSRTVPVNSTFFCSTMPTASRKAARS